MTPATDQKTVARKFTTANPIEFDFYNQDDERVLYITDDETQLQTLTLELKNASPHDIELQTPNTDPKPQNLQGKELEWEAWAAGKELYHFQLSFRPGVLSDKAKYYLKHPAFRLAALAEGWDMKYDPDDTDQTDWVSLLWVGEDGQTLAKAIGNNPQATPTTPLTAVYESLRQSPGTPPSDLQQVLTDLSKTPGTVDVTDPKAHCLSNKFVRKLIIPKLSADAGGGARGTRVHLNYRHLMYQDRKAIVPEGTRTQFVNIINHSGKAYIPLHVGFVGSNTILNDQGKTANELTLRITNISNSDTIKFNRRPASKFTISFDIDDTQARALTKTGEAPAIHIEWDGGPKIELEKLVASSKEIELKEIPRNDSDWNPGVSFQGKRPSWIFTYTGKTERTLGPGESIELKLSNIHSSSPTGYTNLYLHYEDIPGYWDGQFTCLIEKAPLVFRPNGVGIGTDKPKAKLHINSGADKVPAAIFEGGYVALMSKYAPPQLPTAKLHVDTGGENTPAAAFMGGSVGIGTMNPEARLDVKGATADDTTSALRLSDSADKLLFTVQNNGNVGIGMPKPETKLQVAGSLLVDGYKTTTPTGIFFRPKFVKEKLYNLSILPYDHSGDLNNDGISINGYDGVSFCTGSNIRQERMQIAKSGNVGIGATIPKARLDVKGATAGNTAAVLKLSNSADTMLFTVQNDGKVKVNGGVEVTEGKPVQGIPIIDFKPWGDHIDEHSGSEWTKPGSVEFSQPVKQAFPVLVGWHLDYLNKDRSIKEIYARIEQGRISGRTVNFTVKLLIRDNSGNIDDPFWASVDVLVIAQLRNSF